MPVSDVYNLSPIMAEVEYLQPKSVLDVGCGMGLYGAACRNYLDGRWGRCRPEQWEVHIYGIEGWYPYANPMWDAYDKVIHEDFTATDTAFSSPFDLVLMIDSLEHIEKEQGFAFVDRLLQVHKHVIVSVPMGYCPQNAPFNNEFETHRASWYAEDFFRWNHKVLVNGPVCYVASIKGKA